MYEENDIARRLEPPKSLPTPAEHEAAVVSFFGQTNLSVGLSEEKKIFGLHREDRKRHVYVLGKTGTGKTKLMEHLIRSDVYFGHGVCVVDPHGDLVDAVLDFVPEERRRDVIYLNPSDSRRAIAWNPLARVTARERSHVVAGIIEAFSRLFGPSWNPRAEHLLRFSILALIDYGKANLADVLSLLTNAAFREQVIAALHPGVVKQFWEKEFGLWVSDADKLALSSIVNTWTSFLAHPGMFAVFHGAENALDLEAAVREKKIILVSLDKGALGDINATIFGALFIAAFRQALMRVQQPYYLFVDDLHYVATDSFLALLSEGGRYGVSITASHQYLGQLAMTLRQNLLGNAGTLIAFQVGAEDAGILEREFAPSVEARDLINLSLRDFYVKPMILGKRVDPFSGTVLDVGEPKWKSSRQQIMDMHTQKYFRRAPQQRPPAKQSTETKPLSDSQLTS